MKQQDGYSNNLPRQSIQLHNNPKYVIKNTLKLKLHKKSELIAIKIMTQSGTFIISDNNQNKKQFKQLKFVLEQKLIQQGFWNKYHVIDTLGSGAFATVYQVKSIDSTEEKAVKVFNKDKLKEQGDGIQSLNLEIKILKLLNHSNVLRVYEIFESLHSIYIVMDLNYGGTLEDKIKEQQTFKKSEIIEITKQLFEGLKYIHSINIMHRDLKPDNILLKYNEGNHCVISDFGLSSFIDLEKHLYLRCGTPGHVAPEIWKCKKGNLYNEQCDVFSLGVIFHQLCMNGESPFDGENIQEVTRKNIEAQVPYHEQQYQQLDGDLLDLMQRMLEKNPKRRITINEALDHQLFNPNQQSISRLKRQNSELNQVQGDNVKQLKLQKTLQRQNTNNFSQQNGVVNIIEQRRADKKRTILEQLQKLNENNDKSDLQSNFQKVTHDRKSRLLTVGDQQFKLANTPVNASKKNKVAGFGDAIEQQKSQFQDQIKEEEYNNNKDMSPSQFVFNYSNNDSPLEQYTPNKQKKGIKFNFENQNANTNQNHRVSIRKQVLYKRAMTIDLEKEKDHFIQDDNNQYTQESQNDDNVNSSIKQRRHKKNKSKFD